MEAMKKECLECDYYQMMIKGKFYPIGNWTVYKHTTSSGKVYIGITCQNLKRRWREGNGYKNNNYFYRAIKKYGWDNIKHEILFNNFTKEMAKLMEQCLIALYDSFNREYGYNLTLGGEGTLGYEFTKEAKKKMSESLKGRVLTEETKKKLSESLKGRVFTEETKKKMSESFKEKWKDEDYKKKMSESFKGKQRTEETKKKISESHNVKVICTTTNKIFKSIKLAAEYYNLKSSSNIVDCCKGRVKTAGKNPVTGEKLKWAYLR